MKFIHYSPTADLHEIIGTFAYLQHRSQLFQKFFVLSIDSLGNRKKVTCNFSGLIKYITEHSFESIYIFGVSDDVKVLIIEQDEFGVKFY